MNEADRAYEKALDCLEKRDLTERQMRQRLEKAGFSEAACDEAISRLKESGFIDDVRYAARYLETLAAKGRGRLRIAAEMRRKGLADELVRNALEDGTDAAGEYERALAEAMRMLEAAGPDLRHSVVADGIAEAAAARKVCEKINRRLASRGFSWETIGAVMAAVRRRLETGEEGLSTGLDEGEDDV